MRLKKEQNKKWFTLTASTWDTLPYATKFAKVYIIKFLTQASAAWHGHILSKFCYTEKEDSEMP